MSDTVQKMLGMAVALCLFMSAWIMASQGDKISEEAAEKALLLNSNIAKSVSVAASENERESVYSGAEVIYMWCNSGGSGIGVNLNGNDLPAADESGPIDTTPVRGVNPGDKYAVHYDFNSEGEIVKVHFTLEKH